MKLWVDDVRQPPSKDYTWVQTVNAAKVVISVWEKNMWSDTILIDLDYDAGDFSDQGGDYIKILDWLEEQGIVDTGYFFHIHSMNPVGVENMRRIINKNGWREIR